MKTESSSSITPPSASATPLDSTPAKMCTPSAASSRAVATPISGFSPSSRTTISIWRPSMPPSALIFSAAICMPRAWASPNRL